jgi:Ser/Thr protein kinase RdoA (MazF antagonist)
MPEACRSPAIGDADAMRDLAVAALSAYDGDFSTPELIKHRENSIFSVHRADGQRLALRIHRANYHSDAALRAELQWMEALGTDGIEVPRIVHARGGNALVHATTAAVPVARQIDLLTWLNGASLGDLEQSGPISSDARRRIYAGVGRLAAQLHNQSAGWTRPSGFVRHDWFAESLVGETPLWGPFWTLPGLQDEQLSLLLRARDRARLALAAHGMTTANAGLIHADLIADNVIVEDGRIKPIDFDDAGFGWHMFEIATILQFLIEDPDFPALSAAVFEGYRSARTLPSHEEAALPLFLMVRSMTYLGWVQSRAETATASDEAPMNPRHGSSRAEFG